MHIHFSHKIRKQIDLIQCFPFPHRIAARTDHWIRQTVGLGGEQGRKMVPAENETGQADHPGQVLRIIVSIRDRFVTFI